jgi:hypothetical protein
MLSLNRLRGGEVGCLPCAGFNLRVQGLFVSWCFVQPRARITLITTLSDFISVFKQPTSSVVFWSLHHPCHLLTSVFYLTIICSPSGWVALLWYIPRPEKNCVESWKGLCVQTVVKPSIRGSYRTCSSCNSANYRTCSLDGHLPSAHVLACGVTFDVYQTWWCHLAASRTPVQRMTIPCSPCGS